MGSRITLRVSLLCAILLIPSLLLTSSHKATKTIWICSRQLYSSRVFIPLTHSWPVEIHDASSSNLPLSQLRNRLRELADTIHLNDRLEQPLLNVSKQHHTTEDLAYPDSEIQRLIRVLHAPHHRPDDVDVLEHIPRRIDARNDLQRS